jgi:NAD(P)-dependent dehydrogenase (short-subunit alcohol dehydrogenase family)
MFPGLFDLAGKTVIVTGAERDPGCVIALGIAAAGAETFAAGLAVTGPRIRSVAFDPGREEDASRLVEGALAATGRLDAVVLAHGLDHTAPAETTNAHDLDRVIAVNLRSVFRCAQVAARPMLAAGRGAIVVVSSIASMMGVPNLAAYGAAKGGVDQLVRQLAVEWGPRGVRVNAVNPGHGAAPPRLTPMGRPPTGEELAGPVVFLCSDAATFVSGVCLPVDGGATAM